VAEMLKNNLKGWKTADLHGIARVIILYHNCNRVRRVDWALMLRLWSHQWDRGHDGAGKNLVNYILFILIYWYVELLWCPRKKGLELLYKVWKRACLWDHIFWTITSFAQLSIWMPWLAYPCHMPRRMCHFHKETLLYCTLEQLTTDKIKDTEFGIIVSSPCIIMNSYSSGFLKLKSINMWILY
jgi:hypothetical protein